MQFFNRKLLGSTERETHDDMGQDKDPVNLSAYVKRKCNIVKTSEVSETSEVFCTIF